MDYLETKRQNNFVAGLMPTDNSLEIFGDKKTRKVFFVKSGRTYRFRELSTTIKRIIEKRLLSDKQARKDLSGLKWSKALEEYTFCLYGAADNEADFVNNQPAQVCENFRCSNNCRCLTWNSKKINCNGIELTLREIDVIDELATGAPDKLIAHHLGIAVSTLDKHKAHLMQKMKAQSKSDLIYKAIKNGIID